MTILATGLGSSITAADPVILSANISAVRAGLHMSASTASFVASIATLTLAATVLGAGALGDKYGMRRMYTLGLVGTVVFGVLAAAAPNAAVLVFARAAVGVAFALQLGLSLAIVNVVFPPERRAIAISLHLGACFAVAVPLPAVGSLLAAQIGWRTCFLVAPAVSETIEATIMLETAPVELSGAVAAVKSGVGQAAYSLGPAVFALIGTTVFLSSGHDKLAGAGISVEQAREALRAAHGGAGSVAGANVLDPQRAREVVEGAEASMIEAIHTLGWILTVVPVVAIVLVLILVRRSRTAGISRQLSNQVILRK